MGIENRDYYRSTSRFSGGSSHAPMCRALIVANVVVLLLQIFFARDPQQSDVDRFFEHYPELYSAEDDSQLPEITDFPRVSIAQEWLQLDTPKVLQGQVWRLLTCAFCHDRESVWHILFNMLFLWWFGRTLEGMYGSREFLLFYLAGALVASLAFVGLDVVTGDNRPMVGASGAVMAVTMLYAIHFPRDTIYIFFILPIEIRWVVFFYVVFDVHPVLLQLSGDHSADGVAHAAHLGGLAFGYVYWRWGLHLEHSDERGDRLRLWWQRRVGPQRRLRIVRADPEVAQANLDERVDELLAKLHEHGESSLTEDDRRILEAASQRYRTRRGM